MVFLTVLITTFQNRFFSQLKALENRVPHYARMVLRNENCDFCNNASDNKNGYLIFNTRRSEDCFYCENVVSCRDCVDCTQCGDSELCFDCVGCNRCYQVQSSLDCDDCNESSFLLNCRSCTQCFACVNLRHQRYYIFNEQHTEKQYLDFINGINLSSHSEREKWSQKALGFWRGHPRPHETTRMTEDVSGNYIFESRNVHDSALIRKGENLRYCFNLFDEVRDCYDYSSYGDRCELVYECMRCGNGIFNLLFCFYCYNDCSNLTYCTLLAGSEDCFGCVGLQNKRYCILNKQYSRDDYFELVGRIIKHMESTGEWGQFFPLGFSPFPYNHSFAMRYFPVTKDQAEALGLWWYEKPSADAPNALNVKELTDSPPESDSALIVRSELSGRIFRITSTDIKYLRRFTAPLPRKAYDERMNERARRMGGLQLFDQTCAASGSSLRSTIPENSGWIIWDKEEHEREYSS